MHNCLIILISIVILISCGHDHSVSLEKQKAFTIQKEALKELNELDNMLTSLQSSNKELLLTKKNEWEQNMVVIEGMEHDHSNCSHGHSNPTYAISTIVLNNRSAFVLESCWVPIILFFQRTLSIIK